MVPKILAFAGSLRAGSYNKKLIRIAAEGARSSGAVVTEIDLRDFPLPIYDADLESADGLPENAITLKRLFAEQHGLLLACPEYNGSITGVLKNTIDWVSRSAPTAPALAAFSDKVAGLTAASPGALGGLRGLYTVRWVLTTLGCVVLPGQVAVARAHEAFEADGRLRDAKLQASVEELGADVAVYAAKLTAGG
jgi:NAD(P)H-dependent FMN reductase